MKTKSSLNNQGSYFQVVFTVAVPKPDPTDLF